MTMYADRLTNLAARCYQVSLDEASMVGVAMLGLFILKGRM